MSPIFRTREEVQTFFGVQGLLNFDFEWLTVPDAWDFVNFYTNSTELASGYIQKTVLSTVKNIEINNIYFQMATNKADLHTSAYWLKSVHANLYKYKEYEVLGNAFIYPLISQQKGFRYFYGAPRTVDILFKEATVFPPLIWFMILIVILVHILVFKLLHFLYCKVPWAKMTKRKKMGTLDIVIRVVATVLEPGSLNLFAKWSTGDDLQLFSLSVKIFGTGTESGSCLGDTSTRDNICDIIS